MSTVDRRVDLHVPVNVAHCIGLGEDVREYAVPGAVGCVAAMPLPHRLPGTIPIGEISPRDSGAVPVDDALFNAAAITKRASFTSLILSHQGVNSLPLCIREL